jgi:hypothetical protein
LTTVREEDRYKTVARKISNEKLKKLKLKIMNEYILNNVRYSYSRQNRKWKFTFGNNTYLTECPGGKNTADIIAAKLNGAAKRTHNVRVDGIARNAINVVLKEYKPQSDEKYVEI